MSTPLFSCPLRPRPNLPAYFCAQLSNPPAGEIARRMLTRQIDLQLEDCELEVTTCQLGVHALEVFSKIPIPVDAAVRARIAGGRTEWSSAVVTSCVPCARGWRIEMLFAYESTAGTC